MNALLAILLSLVPAQTSAPQSTTPPPSAQPGPGAFRKANSATIQAYVVLLRLRYDLFARWKATGHWPDDPAANAALKGHGEYWADQLKNGHLILGGGMKGEYWDNVALIVFEAASQAEAESIVAGDPAVKAYVFQAQVRPFDVLFLTNKYSTEKP